MVVSASGAAFFVSACTDNGASTSGDPSDPDARASKDGAGGDSSSSDLDGGPGEDTGTTASTCAVTRDYVTACNKLAPDGGDELTCGEGKFDAWCELNDKAINSAAYRRAEAQCLTTKNCAGLARRDCEYRSYATATPTNAQKQVVLAYCQTCEPGDSTCPARKVAYDPAKGPKSTDDVFVAAWELNDALDDEIRTKCTGAALDAGPDAAVCLKAFGNCAGGIYVDHLPDCPP
ncbi:hypothetical protein BH11MYX4_BH11MYX4_68480 [soil metagenome]